MFLAVFVALVCPAPIWATTRPTTKCTTTWVSACRRTWITSLPTPSCRMSLISPPPICCWWTPTCPPRDVRNMMRRDGTGGRRQVCAVAGIRGRHAACPRRCCPDSVRSILKSDRWELLLINSEYKVASDAVNDQIDQPERDPEEVRPDRHAHRRSALHQGYDRDDRPRLPGGQRRAPSSPSSSSSCWWKRACPCR